MSLETLFLFSNFQIGDILLSRFALKIFYGTRRNIIADKSYISAASKG